MKERADGNTATYRRLALVFGAALSLTGFVAVVGWVLGGDTPVSGLPDMDFARLATGITASLAGSSLVLAVSRDTWMSRQASRALGALVALVGLLTLVGYLLGWDSSIDLANLVGGGAAARSADALLMAPNTALCFLLLGYALMLLDRGDRWARRLSQTLAIVAGALGLLALVGFAYGVDILLGATPHVHMALFTAVAVDLASAGILLATPSEAAMGLLTGGTVGGILLRRLLPVILGAPLLIGWLTLIGARAGAYEEKVALSLMAVASVAVFVAVLWNTAKHLDRLDAERRRAESALWESEARFRAAAEGSLDAFYILESVRDSSGAIVDFRVVELNSRGEKLVSIPREAAIGGLLCELLPHQRTEGFFDKYVRVVETGEALDEEFSVSAQGVNASWIRHQVIRLGDGVAITSRDVTQRRQEAEEKARLANDLRLLLESTDEGLYGIDMKGNFSFINSSGARMIGYTAEEVLGRNAHDLIHHSCADGHRYLVDDCPIYEAFHEGRGVRIADEVFWRRDGTSFPVEYSSYPIVERGVITGAVVTFVDITERKEAEARITKLNEDLTRRAAELTATNRELEAFSYSVSHDLRAPLRSIDGFSMALIEDYGDILDEDGKDHLRRVRAASQRMGELIDGMLTLSRLTRSEMKREEVDLSAIAGKIVAELSGSSPGRNTEWLVQPGLIAQGDARLLATALENLLGNAWKFTSQRDSARIEFGASQSDGVTTYFVRDNGAGFDMAYSSKLFGAFQRLHGTTEFSGNGVGLATVQRIIHRHGGRIWAEGQVDVGATFYFTL